MQYHVTDLARMRARGTSLSGMKDDLTMPGEPSVCCESNELALWIGLTEPRCSQKVGLDQWQDDGVLHGGDSTNGEEKQRRENDGGEAACREGTWRTRSH